MAVEVAEKTRPEIGMEDRHREAVVGMLNALLADEYVIYTQARNYHWNVVGPDFGELHAFFEAQYEKLNKIVDDVAERARTMGGSAQGTLEEFLQSTRLQEHPRQYPAAKTMLRLLLASHESIIRSLRQDQDAAMEKYRDAGTNDFLVGLMEKHEKMAWMTRSYLEER